MLKVAVILTGELRYIDFCYKWWQETVKESGFEVNFFSSTWSHLDNATLANNIQDVSSLNNTFPNTQFETHTEDIIFNCNIPKEIEQWCSPGPHKVPYFFGRVMHLDKCMQNNDMSKYDVIMHSRWDCAFRNSNFFKFVINEAVHKIVVSGLKCDMGLLYSSDWVLAGPGATMREIYINSLQKHIDLFNYYYKKDPTVATTYLIGHNLYTTYIQNQLKSISNVNFDITLVRKHNLKFKFDNDTWAKLLEIHLNCTTPKSSKIK